jgi:hypothetical protein
MRYEFVRKEILWVNQELQNASSFLFSVTAQVGFVARVHGAGIRNAFMVNLLHLVPRISF